MKYSFIVFAALSFLLPTAKGQDVVINELMAKNSSSIVDEDGDFSDWIELYNTTNNTISLLNYSISDDEEELNKWAFPKVSILPHSFLLLFASNKDKIDTELHANFKISSGGEDIYLSDNSDIIIDQANAISLSSDQSYGRVPDGLSNWIVINTPTPNESNNGSNELTFSHNEGFYTSPFSLKIISPLPDTIYYTLNGDTPSKNSSVYSDSIFITFKDNSPNIISEIPTTPKRHLIDFKAWESPKDNIDKSTIIRCASFNNGIRTSKIYSKTFFVDEDMLDKYSMPVISLITDANNLFSLDSGIYVTGIHHDTENPAWTGNYFKRGSDWERDVHIEHFNFDGSLNFSQDAGMRIHGGATRHASQKSLRFYARNEYGEKYFNHKLFPHKENDKFKRFILRTTIGAWDGQTIIKDVLAHNISSTLNIDYQDFQPVILYINGEYWGIQTIRDRIDERYISYTHNIDKDSVEFKTSSNVHYKNLISFIENNDLENNANYEYVKTQIDIDNYIDYTIAEQFFANRDWPGFNIDLWRKKGNGKWRWVFYDLDAGYGNSTYNMFEHSILNDSTVKWPNPPSSTFLFRRLIKNEVFVKTLVKRYAKILSTDFRIEKMKNKLDSIKEIYSPEITNHIKRWNYPDSYNRWEKDIDDNLLSFIQERPCYLRAQIVSFFKLSNFDFDCEIFYTGKELILAPNPTNGNFLLFNNSVDIKNALITIINIDGHKVFLEKNVSISKEEIKYFDLSHLLDGLYILTVKSSSHSIQKKIFIR